MDESERITFIAGILMNVFLHRTGVHPLDSMKVRKNVIEAFKEYDSRILIEQLLILSQGSKQ
jgi:hypothetical protein